MTPDKQMEVIQEAAGECWHKKSVSGAKQQYRFHCAYCGLDWEDCFFPSPDDLNEVLRLAEKIINIHNMEWDNQSMRNRTVRIVGNIDIFCVEVTGHGETLVAALRAALVKAIEGRAV
jgi:hypothetical protein